jgi:hypothetical protein
MDAANEYSMKEPVVAAKDFGIVQYVESPALLIVVQLRSLQNKQSQKWEQRSADLKAVKVAALRRQDNE